MLHNLDTLNAKILIVDDQATNVQLLVQLLNESGYTRVSSTMAPQEVCALHELNHYDLILLDLKMPVMDGFEVMAALKQSSHDSYLPIIVLTAEPGHKLRALQAGAKDFISKPFDLLEVKTRIHNMLEVRLLHKQLEHQNQTLEQTVLERTSQLLESEQRFRRLTELASDWYWEQNATGEFTTVSGPVQELLGLRVSAFLGPQSDAEISGWNEAQQKILQAKIANKEPFLNYAFSRINPDGSKQTFRISGEPMVDAAGRFIGFRGIGAEVRS